MHAGVDVGAVAVETGKGADRCRCEEGFKEEAVLDLALIFTVG